MVNGIRPGDRLLGKYEIEHVLGQGGMGLVVAARHLGLGELYAIKLLLPAALAVDEAMERFVREARAAARLKGEHVARVHDVGVLEDGSPYMVMEHLEGTDLKAILKSKGTLSAAEAVHYLAQATQAVSEAHAAGIVHRDIKPANLFLTRRANGTPCVKVLDFGISKSMSIGALGEDASLTRTGTLLGSPLYMAPEQLLKARGIDGRADIWALGVTLYELLTGQSPFKAASLPEVIANVLQEEPEPPSETNPSVTPELERLVARCLRKSADERFQTANELSKALVAVEQQLHALTSARDSSVLSVQNSGIAREVIDSADVPISCQSIEASPEMRSSMPSAPFQATLGVPVLSPPSSKGARGEETMPTYASWGKTAAARANGASIRAGVLFAVFSLCAIGMGIWVGRKPAVGEADRGPGGSADTIETTIVLASTGVQTEPSASPRPVLSAVTEGLASGKPIQAPSAAVQARKPLAAGQPSSVQKPRRKDYSSEW